MTAVQLPGFVVKFCVTVTDCAWEAGGARANAAAARTPQSVLVANMVFIASLHVTEVLVARKTNGHG
jgi:hypothetical protein